MQQRSLKPQIKPSFIVCVKEFLENEHIDGSILSRHIPDVGSHAAPRKSSFRIVSELELKRGNIKARPLSPSTTRDTPPVQRKLFWKKRKQNQQSGRL